MIHEIVEFGPWLFSTSLMNRMVTRIGSVERTRLGYVNPMCPCASCYIGHSVSISARSCKLTISLTFTITTFIHAKPAVWIFHHCSFWCGKCTDAQIQSVCLPSLDVKSHVECLVEQDVWGLRCQSGWEGTICHQPPVSHVPTSMMGTSGTITQHISPCANVGVGCRRKPVGRFTRLRSIHTRCHARKWASYPSRGASGHGLPARTWPCEAGWRAHERDFLPITV